MNVETAELWWGEGRGCTQAGIELNGEFMEVVNIFQLKLRPARGREIEGG